MRVSDCCTSSREVMRCCWRARCIPPIEASTTVKRGGVDGTAASATAATSARIGPLVFIGRRRSAEGAAGYLQQIRLDERIQITVEHAMNVADLHLGAVIFDHLIRLQHVAANLAAEEIGRAHVLNSSHRTK